METIFGEIEKIRKESGYYSDTYRTRLNDLVGNRRKEVSTFIFSYLNNTSHKKINKEEYEIILIIIQRIFPFEEYQIDELAESFVNSIKELNKIETAEEIQLRDYLLYVIMDILFHNGQIIIETKEQIQEKLFNVILDTSELKYEVNEITGNSYLKNYKIIQFYHYFNRVNWREAIIKSYLNHFDLRVQEDMKYELEEYGKA